jgi:peroxiredoxin
LPSLQWVVLPSFPSDILSIVGICNTATVTWLLNYRPQKGITYPMIQDASSVLFTKYRVGGIFGRKPPTYVIIDRAGVVRYRIDDQFNKFDEMIATIRTLL